MKTRSLFFSLLGFLTVCLVMPFLISTFIHFDFVTNYSFGSFSLAEFHKTYFSGIYKYCILGRELFLQFYALMALLNAKGIVLHHISSFTLKHLGNNTQALYYLTQYFNDTVLLILTAMVFYYLFGSRYYQMENAQRNLAVMLCVFLIAVSQFVLTAYDSLFYLILALSLVFALADIEGKNPWGFLGLMVMMVLGALTIEHSVIIMSIYASLYVNKYGFRFHMRLIKLLILIILFFATYAILRITYGFNHGMYDVLALTQVNLKFLHLTIISILFLLGGSFITAGDRQQFKRTLIFLFFSLPYIAAIFTFAYLAEVRVWLPVILPAICIALLKNQKANIFLQ